MIEKRINEHIEMMQKIVGEQQLTSEIKEIVEIVTTCFKNGHKLMFCGNGGSAADAQHLAAEFSGRFYLNRRPLDAEALHVNTSYLTAVGNDFDFATIYERAVEAKGRKGDVLIALSTSGKSENIVRACRKAKVMGIFCISFTGMNKVELHQICDKNILIPSADTPRIQEAHMVLGHIICELVESSIFSI